ncbi:hypothetical protein R0381_001771 [Jeongeupia wiesaeckerbachi]|uniref:hypothetical protein n=1 Tax=Jeongeupia wiesaeckerbachi TaxID=3051218 RepID=UPI003D8087D7
MRARNIHELLIAEQDRAGGDFTSWIVQIQQLTVPKLIASLRHQRNPARRWILQLTLAKQGVPPALRGLPCSDDLDDPQRAYEWWLADVDWLRRVYPTHVPAYERWRRLFTPQSSPAGASWHKTALWVYGHAERSAAYYARGLALTPKQRDELAWLCGRDVHLTRRKLQRLHQDKDKLLREQMARRDKSGSTNSRSVLERRIQLMDIHVLTGRHSTRTAKYYNRLNGEHITRQAAEKQLSKLDELCRQLQRKEKRQSDTNCPV